MSLELALGQIVIILGITFLLNYLYASLENRFAPMVWSVLVKDDSHGH